jgi:macrolide transport system ATP-binding/permease protein
VKSETIIRIIDLNKTYHTGGESLQVLKSVNLEVRQGEFLAIVGASGSGKSTFLQILGLLDSFDKGSYVLNGVETKNLSDSESADLRSKTLGFVFQQFHLLPRTMAWENVSLPSVYSGLQNYQSRAKELLQLVGLGDRKNHKPNQLSGGQQQRVAIARSLINHPKIILADEPTGNLDSKSKKEIMDLITSLNQAGITVIMVTHESDIAKYASRIIYFKDGEIIKEENVKGKASKEISTNLMDTNGEFRKGIWWEAIKGYLSSATKTLLANKARTFLSALGILFGVAAVIAVMALGEGARRSIESRLSTMGSNLLMIRSGARKSGGVALEAGIVAKMTMDDVRMLQRLVPDLKGISGTVNGRAQTVYKNKNWNSQIMGTDAIYSELRNMDTTSGRFFSENENNRRALVAIIGQTPLKELFGDKDPIGEYIKLNRIHFKVIGVLSERGGSTWRDQDDIIIIPIQTAMRRLLNRDTIDGIELEINSSENLENAERNVAEILDRKHNPGKIPGSLFRIMNLADIQAAIQETNDTMSTLLMSIAAVSLLVGGIGIMNIMLVSVKERTREIGLRKAIGARSQDILIQFLIESIMISILGGLLGILVGWSVTTTLSLFADWDTYISATSIFVSIGFSSMTGIVFGLWPANVAANLNPITALRYE